MKSLGWRRAFPTLTSCLFREFVLLVCVCVVCCIAVTGSMSTQRKIQKSKSMSVCVLEPCDIQMKSLAHNCWDSKAIYDSGESALIRTGNSSGSNPENSATARLQ